MSQLLIALSVASFVGGILVASRLGRSGHLLWQAFHRAQSRSLPSRMRSAALAVVLHSGPWLAAITIYVAIHITSTYEHHVHVIFFSGLGLGIATVIALSMWAIWRSHQPKAPSPPLTPERFARYKRRFYWFNALFFSSGSLAATLYFKTVPDHVAIFIFPTAFAVGWLYSWFMWQWVGEALKANDKRRRRLGAKDAV